MPEVVIEEIEDAYLSLLPFIIVAGVILLVIYGPVFNHYKNNLVSVRSYATVPENTVSDDEKAKQQSLGNRPGEEDSSDRCYLHPGERMLSKCRVCGKNLCKVCCFFTPYPHICPFCLPLYYKQKKSRFEEMEKKAGRFMAGSFAAFFTSLLLLISAWNISAALENRDESLHPEPHVYLEKDSVFAVLTRNTYNETLGKVGIGFKIYLTNNYKDNRPGVKIEVLILQNSTIRYESFKELGTILSDRTVVIEFQNMMVLPGSYEAVFVLWEDGMVLQKLSMFFSVSRDDIVETNPKTSSGSRDGFVSGFDPGSEKAFGLLPPVCMFFIVIITAVLLIVAVTVMLISNRRKKSQKREEMLKFIRENPGATFNMIKNATSSGAGSADYNLRKLLEENQIFYKNDGVYKRFFDSTQSYSSPEYEPATRERILRYIAEHPHLTQAEIGYELGLSKQTVNYQIKKLLDENAIYGVIEGIRVEYIVTPPSTGAVPTGASVQPQGNIQAASPPAVSVQTPAVQNGYLNTTSHLATAETGETGKTHDNTMVSKGGKRPEAGEQEAVKEQINY